MRTVLARPNGQLRPLEVRDARILSGRAAIERADADNPDHVAPLTGVVTLAVRERDDIAEGAAIAVLKQ